MNFDFNFLFSGGLIFITGLIYGSMALGRKWVIFSLPKVYVNGLI